MSFKQTLGKIVLVGAAALGVLGIGTAVHEFNQAAHPVSQGQEYLAKKGYTNIQGGQSDYFNMCGKNVYARSYTATDPSTGKAGEHTVCFTPIFGPHSPLFGK